MTKEGLLIPAAILLAAFVFGLFLSFCLDLCQAEDWEARIAEVTSPCEFN